MNDNERRKAVRGLSSSIRRGMSQDRRVSRGPTKSDITADIDDDGDVFVSVRQDENRPAEQQLAVLAATVESIVGEVTGKNLTDDEGNFLSTPEGSITVVVAGSRFLRIDVEEPEEWVELSSSRVFSRVSNHMGVL